jgi:DNA-binding transcriptional LysR family regulator
VIDLSLIRVLCAVYEAGSVSRAAAKLHLTQPAISHALGRLRATLGDPLFVRTKSGMSPTPQAVRLYEQFREAIKIVERAVEETKVFVPASTTRHFRIAMSDIGAMVFLPPILRRLQTDAPHLSVEVNEIAVSDLLRLLQIGHVDMALGNAPHLRALTHYVPLFDEHYVCLMAQHNNTIGDSLSLEQYLSVGHVAVMSPFSGHLMINEALSRKSLVRKVVLGVPHFTSIPDIIAETDLVVTVPSRVAYLFQERYNLKVLPVPIHIPSFSVGLHWSDENNADPGHRWLRQQVADLISATRMNMRYGLTS